jgi:protein phosphatase
MVQEPRISEILQAAPSLDAAGRELIDAANAAGGRDNISVVLVRLGEVEVAVGAAHVADQETSAGRPGDARTEDVRAAAAAVSTVDADPPTTARRLTPIEPPPAQQRPRKRRSPWPRRLLVTGGVLLFFGVPVALGGLLALRSVYFVGSDEQGFVTIYRGLPYELPLDVRLYQRNYTSGISREVVPESRREVISAHELRSRDDAYDYVRQLERGQVVER